MGYKTDLEIQQEARRVLHNLQKGDKIDAIAFLEEMGQLGSGSFRPLEYAMIRRERDTGVFRVDADRTNYTSGYTFHGALDQLRRSYDEKGVERNGPVGNDVIEMLAQINKYRQSHGLRDWVMRHRSHAYTLKTAKHEDKEAVEIGVFESIFDYRAFLMGVITALA
jgi:hypothetical protein